MGGRWYCSLENPMNSVGHVHPSEWFTEIFSTKWPRKEIIVFSHVVKGRTWRLPPLEVTVMWSHRSTGLGFS